MTWMEWRLFYLDLSPSKKVDTLAGKSSFCGRVEISTAKQSIVNAYISNYFCLWRKSQKLLLELQKFLGRKMIVCQSSAKILKYLSDLCQWQILNNYYLPTSCNKLLPSFERFSLFVHDFPLNPINCLNS